MSQKFDGRVDSVVIEFRERVMDELNVFETCACCFDISLLYDPKMVVFSIFSLRGSLPCH
ncbi:hypothetical protein SAMN06264867_11513 [Halorubrum cibi]|uniref:Uncharacterized protein n=1 Tax=Halorubrum cibi TaxID=413815 RepID=A0A521F3C3_9EURY|nr:hypothetical protein SAMN06264867_11513 [Halorubrum cibi]